MESREINKTKEIICYHCGDTCRDRSISKDDKYFCCQSCKIVYEILEENKLCQYYNLESSPGISPAVRSAVKYEYLDDEQIKRQLLDFSDGKHSTVTFYIPQMHCSSCIWLLENLYKLNRGVTHSNVNFLQKKLTVKFLGELTTLRQIAELLDSLGYEPLINLESAEKKSKSEHLKKLYYKVGVAGFSFGNIMLLSFPEYLGLERLSDPGFHRFFGFMNLILMLPVFFYSSSEYYISAYKGLKNGIVNIDLPLFIGILALFVRSCYEIITQTGAGYSDSLAGLVFFLLIGKVFQNKTYESMSFERTYKSYFPLSVTVITKGKEGTVPVSKLRVGDRIVIRNNELIPADSILFRGDAYIDYSFVTGESLPVKKVLGEIIYAGGRQSGGAIELEIMKDISQSYLTQLWNNDVFRKDEEVHLQTFSNTISRYFTAAVLILASASAALWLPVDFNTAMNVFSAVLIVACPCALALAIPFAFGNIMRLFGRHKFYIKNTSVIERLSKITAVVFDKTGTITQSSKSSVSYSGTELNRKEKSAVKSLARQSTHPLSRKIYDFLSDSEITEISGFSEITGSGVTCVSGGLRVSLGSSAFIHGAEIGGGTASGNSSNVFVSVNGIYKGFFSVSNLYRKGLADVISDMKKRYELHLLSGDHEGEKQYLRKYFGDTSKMHFRQSPSDKLVYIKNMQDNGQTVLMIGDGLNDAGALKQSDIGISVSEDVTGFSPACDAILDSESFTRLDSLIRISRISIRIIIASFAISFLYNIGGIGLAIQGFLKPLFAAILMPVSSISVVLFSVLTTNYFAKKYGFK